MKNIYVLFILLIFTISNNAKANCPASTAPSNLNASSICEKGFSTFTGTLNDLSNTLVWLDSANRIIGSGNHFQHYINDVGLNFKAAEVGYDLLNGSVGPIPSQFTSTYPSQNFTNGQYFTCQTTLRIDSILLRSNNPVQGYIQIWTNAPENNGYILQKFPFNITSGGPANTRIPLAAILTSGNYFINVEITGGSGILYRALTGASYPYQISNLISITGNNFGAANNRYYYFFDWDVSKMCISPLSASFSPTYIQTKAETLPYQETFNIGIPCDWNNSAANANGIWQSGASSTFSSSTFTIPSDPHILFSSDINCNCDKSNSVIRSPWFDLRSYSKNTNMKLLVSYVYRAAQGSKVYVKVRNGNNSIQLIDSLSAQLGSYVTKQINFTNFILSDSVQFIVEHKDMGGDSSAIAISNIELIEECPVDFTTNLDLTLDSYASEISWEIRDAQTRELIAINLPYTNIIPYQINIAKDARSICLTEGKSYVFKIMDSFGDGLNDGINIGNYLLTNSCGDTILKGSGAFPYGGIVLPDLAYDSVIFSAKKSTPNLGRDRTITLDDTLILDAGKYGPYLWSTGDTTQSIRIIGRNLGTGNYTYSVAIREQSCLTRDTISIEVVPIFSPKIFIHLITDTKGSEITWELKDANTDTIIKSRGPFNDIIPYNVTAATHIDSVNVEFNQEILFEIKDLAGNGLFDGTNQGSIRISNNCKPIIFSNNSKTFPFANGLQTYDSVVFNSDVKPMFVIGADFEICDDETITLNAGSSAYEYLWSIGNTSVTGNPISFNSSTLLAGENTIIVRNNSGAICFASDTIIITKNENPSSVFSTTQQGGLLTCEANEIGASIYSWNFGDGNSASGKNVTHQYASNGNYMVQLTVVSIENCTSTSSKNIIINGVGIANYTNNNFELFPNPSNGKIILSTTIPTVADIQIIDMQGRVLQELKTLTINNEYELNIQHLEKGTYIARISTIFGNNNIKLILK